MTIQQIYHKYQIPPNLQLHMIRVTAMGNFLLDRWKQPTELDRDIITKALLLHDMGNLIKSNPKRDYKILGIKLNKIAYWKEIQAQMIKEFGKNDHVTTNKIANELGTSKVIIGIIDKIAFIHSCKVHKSNNWHTKICAYADKRVSPKGVVTLKERFREVDHRYRNKPNFNIDSNKISEFQNCLFKLETQIQTQVTIDLQSITAKNIEPYLDKLKTYEI